MKRFISQLYSQAKKSPKRIVFIEVEEPRVLKALTIILKRKIAHPILVGDHVVIEKQLKKYKISPSKVHVYDPTTFPSLHMYATKLVHLRPGLHMKEAIKLLHDPIYLGTMMVKLGDAHGLVSGAVHPTAHTLKPAFQIIKTHERFHKASGLFFMMLDKRLLLFADCSVNVAPDAKDLAGIAYDSAMTAKEFGIRPKVAMLSFSTHGSAHHHYALKMKEATQLLKAKAPLLISDGEVQVDAALVPKVAALKSPKSKLKGDANILIFPNLDAGNIAYKLVERLAGAHAIGPIIQGLQKPVNDLSRGCSVEDIVQVTAVTVIQAQHLARKKSSVVKKSKKKAARKAKKKTRNVVKRKTVKRVKKKTTRKNTRRKSVSKRKKRKK